MKLFKGLTIGGIAVAINLTILSCTGVQYQTRWEEPARQRSQSDNFEGRRGGYATRGERQTTPGVNEQERSQPHFQTSRASSVAIPPHVKMGALKYQDTIIRISQRYGNDPLLMIAIVEAESRGNTLAISSSNCRGLTQLKLSTARDYMPEVTLQQLHDPVINLEIASRHMAILVRNIRQTFPYADEWQHVALVAAAWNAGWGNVKRSGGIPNIAETKSHVERVLMYYQRLKSSAY
jgi:soluble lytic murein transglycosylase-like protein